LKGLTTAPAALRQASAALESSGWGPPDALPHMALPSRPESPLMRPRRRPRLSAHVSQPGLSGPYMRFIGRQFATAAAAVAGLRRAASATAWPVLSSRFLRQLRRILRHRQFAVFRKSLCCRYLRNMVRILVPQLFNCPTIPVRQLFATCGPCRLPRRRRGDIPALAGFLLRGRQFLRYRAGNMQIRSIPWLPSL